MVQEVIKKGSVTFFFIWCVSREKKSNYISLRAAKTWYKSWCCVFWAPCFNWINCYQDICTLEGAGVGWVIWITGVSCFWTQLPPCSMLKYGEKAKFLDWSRGVLVWSGRLGTNAWEGGGGGVLLIQVLFLCEVHSSLLLPRLQESVSKKALTAISIFFIHLPLSCCTLVDL